MLFQHCYLKKAVYSFLLRSDPEGHSVGSAISICRLSGFIASNSYQGTKEQGLILALFLEEGSLVPSAKISNPERHSVGSGIMCRPSESVAAHSYFQVEIVISELLVRKSS